jgi:hypothetical protein
MDTLPLVIDEEIFDLRHRISEMALNHLTEDLDGLGLTITGYEDMDHALILTASHNDFKTEIRVDRIRCCFDVQTTAPHGLFMPASGNWFAVMEYLQVTLADPG